MDLHEWEILSDDGLLDFKDDEKKIVSAKRSSSSASDAKIVFDMNYFLCPSMDSKHLSPPPRSSSRLPKQPMIPVHLQLDSPIVEVPDDSSLAPKEKDEVPVVIGVVPAAMSEKNDQKGAVEADQDTVTQVFFKKMKENEFVDMKIDSPRSSNKGAKAQIDVGRYQFDDGGEAKENITNSPRMNSMSQKSNKESDAKDEMNWDGSIGGLNILKWSLNGIGAICSFGVAAATICILFYGGSHQQKLRIQIYTDDKKLKQAVQQATRLNEAIAATRGLPQTRAHITCGGRYDAL